MTSDRRLKIARKRCSRYRVTQDSEHRSPEKIISFPSTLLAGQVKEAK